MRFLWAAVVLGTLACVDPFNPRPGSALAGSWTNGDLSGFPATFAASAAGATLSTPCWAAQFGYILLNDSLTFQDTGVVTRTAAASGVGAPYVIAGRVEGHNLIVNGQTFTPGSSGFRVCTA